MNGAAGMDPFVKATGASEEEIKKTLDNMPNVGQHEDGDYILEDGEEIDVLEEKKKKRKKPEQSLQKNPRFEIGSNARAQKVLKEAGLIATLPTEKEDTSPAVEEAEKKERSTPPVAQHLRLVRNEEKEMSWGKKGSKRKRNEDLLRTLVREETEKVIYGKTISEGLGFTLLMTCLLGIMFIATALADILLS